MNAAELDFLYAQRKKAWQQRHRWMSPPPETWCSLIGDVTDASVGNVIAALERDDNAPIIMQLDSAGGYIQPALELYGRLRQHPAPLTICAGRRCDSAAVPILMAGDIRIASPATTFLIHGVAKPPLGRPSVVGLRAAAQELELLDGELASLIVMRSAGKYSRWELRADMDREVTLDAHSALLRGIVTALI
jgi:ATP-dependent protease ClpP protease subunit